MDNSNIPHYDYGSYDPAMAAPVRPQIEFSQKERILAALTIVLGFGLIRLVWVPLNDQGQMGLGTSLFLLVLCAFCGVFTEKRTKAGIFRLALAAAFSLNVFITSNTVIQALSFVFTLMILIFDRISLSGAFHGIGANILPDFIVTAFKPIWKGFELIGVYRPKKGVGKWIGTAAAGLLIAAIPTLIVGVLLSSADDRFSSVMDAIVDGGVDDVFENIIYIGLGLPAALYIFAMCWCSAHDDLGGSEFDGTTKGFLPAAVCAVSVVPVCVLYVIFFFTQLSYYLAAFENLLPEKAATYSNFAREGFFELCAVAVINLFMIIAINCASKKNEGKTHTAVRVMSIILSVFTIALIVTAMSRMIMYIGVYGLTRLRLYTGWFMVLLGIFFAGVIVFFVKKYNLAKFIIIAFTLMFSLLAFSRTDAVIADYNLSRYCSGQLETLNVRQMSRELSEDIRPVIAKYSGSLAQDEQEEMYSENGNYREWETYTLNTITE